MVQAKYVRLKNTGPAARSRSPKSTSTPQPPVDKDSTVANLIQGLNLLAAHARQQGLGNAARILATAKEDLVYWAVDLNFAESPKDRFINQHLYGTNLQGELMQCLGGEPETRSESLTLLHDFNGLMERATALAMRGYFGSASLSKDNK